MRSGKGFSFIEEEGFEQIIEYFTEKEQFIEALEASEMAITQFSYSSSLLILKADILISLRRYEESLFILEKAELLDWNDIDLYIVKTDALLALDKQEEAAYLLEAAIELFEGEEKIGLLFELTDVYDDYEKFDKVFDCLKLILEQEPDSEEALYKICFWTDYTGRNEESIKLHQSILDINPFSELAWFNLGAAYQGIKLYEKSIDAYQYSVALNEKFDYAYRNMGDAFIRLKKYKEAIESLEKVLELSLPEYVIYEAIGHCYERMQNFAQARFHYKKASHLNPGDCQMHYKIATTYMNEGAWQNAIKSLQTALKFHLLQPDYNLALGRCYLELENYDEAITYLEKFSSDDAMLSSFAKGAIGDAYAQKKQFKEALEYYLKAAESNKNDFTTPRYLLKAGKTSLTLGNKEGALKYFTDVKDNYSDTPEAQGVDALIGLAQ